MKFSKMQGAGNDYVYVNCFTEETGDRPSLAIEISDRHFGVGGDGLICICPSDTADFKMDMYNLDGSRGLMCGNGIRCVGKYVYDRGLTEKTEITVETPSGIKKLQLFVEDGAVKKVRVNMGAVSFKASDVPVLWDGDEVINSPLAVDGAEVMITALSVGNPHAVTFVPDVHKIELEKMGPMIESHVRFPERVNAEFVEVLGNDRLRMRVWERGSGETLACGTGACASLAAACVNGHSGDRATVLLEGGELEIEWDREKNEIFLTGGAEFVFDGTYSRKS